MTKIWLSVLTIVAVSGIALATHSASAPLTASPVIDPTAITSSLSDLPVVQPAAF